MVSSFSALYQLKSGEECRSTTRASVKVIRKAMGERLGTEADEASTRVGLLLGKVHGLGSPAKAKRARFTKMPADFWPAGTIPRGVGQRIRGGSRGHIKRV